MVNRFRGGDRSRREPPKAKEIKKKRTYYDDLGVSRDANDDEIKKAHRRLAMKYHPDRNPDDPAAEENFRRISEAYAVLRDPEKKSTLDDRLSMESIFAAAGLDLVLI